MQYITHKRHDGTYQPLKEHLEGTAATAADFAASFGASAHAFRTALLHDIGKYSPAAQARQIDPEHVAKVDHTTMGAQEAHRLRDISAAFAIAGHHGGLLDLGSKASGGQTLMARLKKDLSGDLDSSIWTQEVDMPTGDPIPAWSTAMCNDKHALAWMMYTRMLFSCLVDADYLDTEAFMRAGNVVRGSGDSLSVLYAKLLVHIAPWLQQEASGLNSLRTGILRHCLQGGARAKGLYSLTVPTGGGKTISSLAFALSHAVKHKMARVIYVVPYTSIIEQNAQVFRDILGKENVLEHHANVEIDDASPMRLAAENWDAPVIVTTAVQFFESLFAAKTSRCRKLHNIANAVIVFDEAQMMPVPYLRPCIQTISELTLHYGATAVLCTATQPPLAELFKRYNPDLHVEEICPETDVLFSAFQRTRYQSEGILSENDLGVRLQSEEQVLCIVNSRKTARNLYELLPPDGRYHLSTLMTPEDRSCNLAEIRQRLQKGLRCRVISTSLIEAGVDVDFPTVWREMAGLDSILQAGGRCNREGKRAAEVSIVHIFRFEKKPSPMFLRQVAATETAIARHSELSSPEAVQSYFNRLFLLAGDEALDQHEIIKLCQNMAFRTIAERFKLIDSKTVPVYIPTPDNAALLQALRNQEITRSGLRRLARYAVNVYEDHFKKLQSVLEISYTSAHDEHGTATTEPSYGILVDTTQYSSEVGLALEPEDIAELFG